MLPYYNDNDPYVIEWLKKLARAGHLPYGVLDSRSIKEVAAGDVSHSSQAHFFVGIGGWPLALELAGWPDDAEVWTGSCPCQPFSTAGRARGFDDERHLWPEWFRLVRECRPPAIFGEQVASPAGRAWLDLVFADLEGAGYACGTANLCAAGVGAPHIRQRLYWVALTDGERLERIRVQLRKRAARQAVPEARGRGEARELADTAGARRGRARRAGGEELPREKSSQPRRHGEDGRLGDTSSGRGGRDAGVLPGAQAQRRPHGREPDELVSPGWHDCEWIPCRDPKRGVVYRPVEPGSFPLAHGVPGRVGRLRAYGNAVVSEVAAIFVRSVIEMLAGVRDVAE